MKLEKDIKTSGLSRFLTEGTRPKDSQKRLCPAHLDSQRNSRRIDPTASGPAHRAGGTRELDAAADIIMIESEGITDTDVAARIIDGLGLEKVEGGFRTWWCDTSCCCSPAVSRWTF
jgi:hypothetical protein